MKRFFSFCMIICATVFYSSYGQNGLQLLATAATVKTEFETFQEYLTAEIEHRDQLHQHLQSHKHVLAKESRKKLYAAIAFSRNYIQASISNPTLEILQPLYYGFSAHIEKQNNMNFYLKSAQYKKDSDLLLTLKKAVDIQLKNKEKLQLTAIQEDHPEMDLTKSMVCISLLQQTTSNLKRVPQAREQKEAEIARLNAEIKALNEQEKRDKAKQEFVTKTLKQKKENKEVGLATLQAQLVEKDKALEPLLAARNQLAQQVEYIAKSREAITTALGEFEVIETGDEKQQA